MIKVSIFGASGRTGLLLTERCLAAGYEVTALLRTPATFRFRDQVRVVEGSIFDAAAVRRTVAGTDVVLSTLGARSLKRENLQQRAVPLILEAMRAEGVRRIITLGGASGDPDSLRRQPWAVRVLLKKLLYEGLLKWPAAEQRAQLAVLRSSGLGWTIVLPPMLTDGPARGRIRTDGDALPPRGSRIARADVANFMLRQIENSEWVGKAVFVAW